MIGEIGLTSLSKVEQLDELGAAISASISNVLLCFPIYVDVIDHKGRKGHSLEPRTRRALAHAAQKIGPHGIHGARPGHWGIVISPTRGRAASYPCDSFCSLSPWRGRSTLGFAQVS